MDKKSILESKVRKLMAKRLSECKAKQDYFILLDGKIVSTTRHTQGQLHCLIRQAEGVARSLKFFRVSELEWSRGESKLEIKLYEGQKITLDMCRI